MTEKDKEKEKDKKSNQIHVMYDKETKTWYGKQDNAEKKSFVNMPTQEDAIQRMMQIAKNQKLEGVIHRKDNNQIREKNSYGKDNYPPEG